MDCRFCPNISLSPEARSDGVFEKGPVRASGKIWCLKVCVKLASRLWLPCFFPWEAKFEILDNVLSFGWRMFVLSMRNCLFSWFCSPCLESPFLLFRSLFSAEFLWGLSFIDPGGDIGSGLHSEHVGKIFEVYMCLKIFCGVSPGWNVED